MSANDSNNPKMKGDDYRNSVMTRNSSTSPSRTPAPPPTNNLDQNLPPTPNITTQAIPEKPYPPTTMQAPQYTINATTAPPTNTEPFPPFPVSMPAHHDDATAVRNYLAYVFSDVVSTRCAYQLAGKWKDCDGGWRLRWCGLVPLKALFCAGVEGEGDAVATDAVAEYLYERVKADRDTEDERTAREGGRRSRSVFGWDMETEGRLDVRARRRTVCDVVKEEEGQMWRFRGNPAGGGMGRSQDRGLEMGNVVVRILAQILLVGVALCACVGGFATAFHIGSEFFRYIGS